jgi:2-dehydro-3-deoxyphosphooctonate aldolase (KDO 8-P synthase)
MNNLFFIAGPCLAESKEMLFEVAEELKAISYSVGCEIIFKASYRKANRTSINSFAGVGDEIALNWLAEVKEKFDLKVLTDVHSPDEATLSAKYVDLIQIPAFLCRQTDLLIAAGETGKTVNIKKGQFVSPETIIRAANKVASTGNSSIMLTERGTFFGYNDLVVDFRSLPVMKKSGYPVIYDATHSLQRPSIGEQSGGFPELIPYLARGAVAVGVDGIFFETHPNPKVAMSDKDTQLPLAFANKFINELFILNKLVNNVIV